MTTGTNEKTIPSGWSSQFVAAFDRYCAVAAAAGFGFLGKHLVGGVFESLGFGQEGQRFLNHRIPVGHDAQTLELTELAGDDLFLDVDLQPIHVVVEVLFGQRNVLAGEELLEVGQDRVVDLEVLVDGAVGEVMRGEVEEALLS